MLVFERCLFKRIYRIWAELPVPAVATYAGTAAFTLEMSDDLDISLSCRQWDESGGKVWTAFLRRITCLTDNVSWRKHQSGDPELSGSRR